MCSSSTRSVSIGPLGETLTWPPSPLGAVATKNMRWRAIHAASRASIASKTLAIAHGGYRRTDGMLRRIRFSATVPAERTGP